MSIGENIRRLREKKKITQEQLAERLGIRQAAVSKIERNLLTPQLPLAKLIADALGCTCDDLVS